MWCRYSDAIVQLKADFSARKKKGKLPNEATGALKAWWDANLVWPYPSEDEKKALEEQTGLTATQINNWFINQRKRHWHKVGPLNLFDVFALISIKSCSVHLHI